MKPDFLTSCFLYYESLEKPQNLSSSFTKINSHPLLIIDYPNVIHILNEKFPNEVAKHFIHFLSKHSNHIIVVLCKKVTIQNQNYNIDHLLNQTTQIPISRKNIHIYEIDYEKHISSSMDDLLGHFICFVCFTYYTKSISNPSKQKSKIQKHIQYITNDKQMFNKHLFGKTLKEYPQEIQFKKITYDNQTYKLVRDKTNETLLRKFFKKVMIFKTNDTKHLECNMKQLVKLIPSSRKNRTYKKIDQIQRDFLTNKNKTQKIITRPCDTSLFRKKHLLPSYYLYGMFKNTQEFLTDDFYGSFSREEIGKLFALK